MQTSSYSPRRGIDYIGVGVGAILVDIKGRLFLARRGPKAKNERGLWEFPGGSVEFGETLAQALPRVARGAQVLVDGKSIGQSPAETVVLELIPGATGSAYNGSWVLRELRRLKGSVQ